MFLFYTLGKPYVFWCFQVVQKGNIGLNWVNVCGEAATGGFLFLETSQISQENACVFQNLCPQACNFIKKRLQRRCSMTDSVCGIMSKLNGFFTGVLRLNKSKLRTFHF